jgi:hypothetical protein
VHILVIVVGGGENAALKGLSDPVGLWDVLVRCCVKMGQSEPAPTSAPMWMDGALMSAPFSSLLIPGLTKVANSSWPFSSFPQPRLVFFLELFFSSPLTPAQVSPTYLPLNYYLCTLASSLPHLPTFPSTYLFMYLHTKSPARQWWCRLMKVLQYTR